MAKSVGSNGETDRAASSEPETLAVRALHLAASDADRQLADRLGMRPLDLTAMIHVTSAEPPLGPKQLSDRIGITPGATTELIDRLQLAGHLRRVNDDDDRRRVNLTATNAALSAIAEQLAGLGKRLDELAAQYSGSERTLIRRYLTDAADIFRDF